MKALQWICLCLSIFPLNCFAIHSATLPLPDIRKGPAFTETSSLYPSAVNMRDSEECVGEMTRDAVSGGDPYAPQFKSIMVPQSGQYLVEAQAIVCRAQQGNFRARLKVNYSNSHHTRLGRSFAESSLIQINKTPTTLIVTKTWINLPAGKYIGPVLQIVNPQGKYNKEAMVFISGWVKVTLLPSY